MFCKIFFQLIEIVEIPILHFQDLIGAFTDDSKQAFRVLFLEIGFFFQRVQEKSIFQVVLILDLFLISVGSDFIKMSSRASGSSFAIEDLNNFLFERRIALRALILLPHLRIRTQVGAAERVCSASEVVFDVEE